MATIIEGSGVNARGEDVDGLLCVEHDGFMIVNPYESECRRFPVDPSYYGLTATEAARIWAHNAPLLGEDVARPPSRSDPEP